MCTIAAKRPNLRHLCEPLRGAEGLVEQWVLRRRHNVCDEEQVQMPEGSEFHTILRGQQC